MAHRVSSPSVAASPDRSPHALKLAATVLLLVGLGLSALISVGHAGGSTVPASRAGLSPKSESAHFPTVVEEWAKKYTGQVITLSSPISAVLDSTPAAVVGTMKGEVLAVNLATGATLKGWPVTTPGATPIIAAPSTAKDIVYVGVGDSAVAGGGFLALRGDGDRLWWHTQSEKPGNNVASRVEAGMTYGILDGVGAVFDGTMGEFSDAYNASSGKTLAGFPWFSADSVTSTAAIAPLYGPKTDYVIEGGGQTAGLAYQRQYYSGGHIRIIEETGNKGQSEPWKGTVCDFAPGKAGAQPNETIDSSPAVGRFLDHNDVGIVVGTGHQFSGVSDLDTVFGLTTHCKIAWQRKLDGWTNSSPALVNARGTGQLEIAEGACVNCGGSGTPSGTVYLLNGGNGATLWSTNVPGEILGSITSAQLSGDYQDLLVPTTRGLYVLDGKTGKVITVIGQGLLGMESSALVTDDADGTIGVTLAGYDGAGGVIAHYEFKGTDGSLVDEAGAWPMFHHDSRLSGSTLTTVR